MTVNVQLVSQFAQRQLDAAQSVSMRAVQRLSSGLRINSASDDAAGLAIGARLTARLRSLDQATRNASDGVSLVQVADGALSSVTDILQRIRELAVEASNATQSSNDRQGLNTEAQQLLSELNRIASSTQFNGVAVLQGSTSAQTLQIGTNATDKLDLALPDARWSALVPTVAGGPTPTTVKGTITVDSSPLAFADVTLDAGSGPVAIIASTSSGGLRGADTAYAKAQAINASGIAGVTASADTVVHTNVLTGADITAGVNDAVTATGYGSVDQGFYSLSLNGTTVYSQVWTGGGFAISANTLAASINLQTASTGVSAVVSGGQLHLSNTDGATISSNESLGSLDTADGSINTTISGRSIFGGIYGPPGNDGSGQSIALGNNYNGTVSLTSATSITIGGSGATPTPWLALGFASATVATGAPGGASVPATVDVSTVSGAQATLTSVDTALASVAAGRVQLGAQLSRLDSIVSSNGSSTTNLQAVRSRIVDADFASETTALLRANIIQRAASALIAQANASSGQVLQLLK